MFHSKHPAALLHATARVVSGSGIYVSDKPGAHDVHLLQRLVLPNGSVIRPQLPGRPTQDILFADVLKDNKTLLKVCISLRLLVCSTCCAGISNYTCFCFRRKSLNVCKRTVCVSECVNFGCEGAVFLLSNKWQVLIVVALFGILVMCVGLCKSVRPLDSESSFQVWNTNPVNGLVGVFNVQGSSWSRKKRRFFTHDPFPPVLETLVTPTHVHSFAQPGSAPQHFAMWSDQTQALVLSAHQEDGMTVRLAAGGSDVITVAPIFGVGTAVQVACIGLVNMLNAGGSVLSVKLQEGQGNRKGIFCEVLVKGAGSLVLYASAPPVDAHGNGAGLRHSYSDQQKKLTVQVPVTSDLQTMVQIRF